MPKLLWVVIKGGMIGRLDLRPTLTPPGAHTQNPGSADNGSIPSGQRRQRKKSEDIGQTSISLVAALLRWYIAKSRLIAIAAS